MFGKVFAEGSSYCSTVFCMGNYIGDRQCDLPFAVIMMEFLYTEETMIR